MKLDLHVMEKTCSHCATQGIIITDHNETIVAVNDSALRLTGYSKEQLIGQPLRLLTSNEHYIAVYESIWESVIENGYWEGEIRNVQSNGKIFFIKLTVYALASSIDKSDLYVWCFSDLEERSNDVEPKQMLEAIYKASPMAVTTLHKDMTVKDWSDTAQKLFGWKKEEAIGQPLLSLLSCHSHYIASFLQQIAKGDIPSLECTARRKDGTVIDIACSIVSIARPDGTITGYIVMINDITKTKQKELEYKKQVELAKKIQQSVLTAPIQSNVVTMDAIYIPSEDLSGDMYACYQIDSHRYGVIIIDVMGHGLSASLVSMSLRSLLRGLILRVIDPVYVAAELEKHLQNLFPDQANDMHYLFSMIYLVIDTKTKQIEYTNAGHPAGLLLMDDGNIVELDKGGLAIGSPFSVPFDKGVVRYHKRTRLFLYTDGILDEIDSSILNSMAKIRGYVKHNRHLSDQQFLQLFVEKHLYQSRPADDICLLSITINEK
ncbi:SpoIIE family protein phosphatase [Thermaerobacillus caldiproteolyticus]|uniref:SpoIIE family protein phosphatase n=1 Tax=Thermaerobacillus caldiproteolyticus TaxID=247480 RepID=UPI001E3E5521|nr:SpoIIE family protein phosphatase [Anoxybacillus caldiproteolyticus]